MKFHEIPSFSHLFAENRKHEFWGTVRGADDSEKTLIYFFFQKKVEYI